MACLPQHRHMKLIPWGGVRLVGVGIIIPCFSPRHQYTHVMPVLVPVRHHNHILFKYKLSFLFSLQGVFFQSSFLRKASPLAHPWHNSHSRTIIHKYIMMCLAALNISWVVAVSSLRLRTPHVRKVFGISRRRAMQNLLYILQVHVESCRLVSSLRRFPVVLRQMTNTVEFYPDDHENGKPYSFGGQHVCWWSRPASTGWLVRGSLGYGRQGAS